jgi:hypothetical protein
MKIEFDISNREFFRTLTFSKNTKVWGISSMETYLTSIMIRKKRH